jgi:hypothetical protein
MAIAPKGLGHTLQQVSRPWLGQYPCREIAQEFLVFRNFLSPEVEFHLRLFQEAAGSLQDLSLKTLIECVA